jgi:hypothetical protein
VDPEAGPVGGGRWEKGIDLPLEPSKGKEEDYYVRESQPGN